VGIRRGCTLGIAALAAVGAVLSPVPSASANAPNHAESDVDIVLPPGGSGTLERTIPTTEVPPKPDLFFLSDTTSSMGAPIAAVRTDSARIVSDVLGAQPTSRFGVAEYRDVSAEPLSFRVDQQLTSDRGAIAAGFGQWVAAGGGDVPEDSLNALYRLANGAASFRENGTRMVLWFGDAPSHDPSNGHSLARTVAALQAADIRVVAVDVGRLNADGQAGAIAAGTGGVLLRGIQPDDITRAILAGISPIRVTVTPKVLGCDPRLSMEISPPRRAVVSGSNARFNQHVTVSAGAEAGDYSCKVEYKVDGKPGIVERTTVRVRGISIDDVTVHEGTGGHTKAVFTVCLDGPSSKPVSVDYTTVAGSAGIPEDLASSSGTLTFPPGQTTRWIYVRIVPDSVDEPKEMFTVNLSNAVGAGITDAVGVGTIVDDDWPLHHYKHHDTHHDKHNR
jgi:hypothetical protein